MPAPDVLSALVDQREPAEILEQVTRGLAPAVVESAMLAAGDAWLACADGAMLVVERKTPSNLLNSVRDGRLFNQAREMREISAWCYVVITGVLMPGTDGRVWIGREAIGGWNWNSVQGALLTLQEAGVGVLTLRGDDEYADALGRLAGRKRETMRIPPVRDMRITTPGEQILSALPGIGIERAGAILEACATPALALVSLTTHLADRDNPLAVPGIGAGIRAKVRAALGLPDDTELAIDMIETKGNGHGQLQTS